MAKQITLDALDLGSKKKPKIKASITDTKKPVSRIQKACYFDAETVATIETFVLDQKQKGNRGASFNKCVNEALALFQAEHGL